jgi:hypothetical protein
MGDEEKPELHLLGEPFSPEAVLDLFRALTGREPTEQDVERVRKILEENEQSEAGR